MNTLILSCNTGQGHNSCAKAIKEYYEIQGQSCAIADALAFVSEDVSKLVEKGHVLMYRKFSGIFDWGYEYAQNHRENFDEDSHLYHFFSRGTQSLYHFITVNGFDHILCTHPFAAMMVTDMRRRLGLQGVTGFVATDYTCCPGVDDTDLDCYFIPDEDLVGEFVDRGIPEERILPSGIPVKQAFLTHRPKEEAKAFFGIKPQNVHIVMAFGSMGCGPMDDLAQELADNLRENQELTIVCGTNDRLLETMERHLKGMERVHVRGFVGDMPQLLDSADIYITKPGGLSTSEAVAKGTFMALFDTVGGCESYNLQHMLNRGAAVTGESVEEFARECIREAGMPHKVPHHGPCNSARFIYEAMEKRSPKYEKEPQNSCP